MITSCPFSRHSYNGINTYGTITHPDVSECFLLDESIEKDVIDLADELVVQRLQLASLLRARDQSITRAAHNDYSTWKFCSMETLFMTIYWDNHLRNGSPSSRIIRRISSLFAVRLDNDRLLKRNET